MNRKAWARVRLGCPQCGEKLQYHSLSVWCNHCRWARNWREDER